MSLFSVQPTPSVTEWGTSDSKNLCDCGTCMVSLCTISQIYIPSESIASFSGANSASLESESLAMLIPNFELRSTTSFSLAGSAFFLDDLHTTSKRTDVGAGPTSQHHKNYENL